MLSGLAADPNNEILKSGLEEAKKAVEDAKGRYTEMWGDTNDTSQVRVLGALTFSMRITGR